MDENTSSKNCSLWKCMRTEKATCHSLMCIYWHYTPPQRLIMIILIIFGIALGHVHEICLNLAFFHINQESSNMTFVERWKTIKREVPIKDRMYSLVWPKDTENYLLGSFSLGFVIGQIPAGLMCDKHGSKWFLLGGMIISTVCTVFMPIAIVFSHWSLVCVLRLLIGASQAMLYPAGNEILARWVPPRELATLTGPVISAFGLSCVLGNIPVVYITKYSKSWIIVFYYGAIISSSWCLLYFFYAFQSPSDHPFLTTKEREYLDHTIVKKHHFWPPIELIFREPLVIAMIFTQYAHVFCLYTIVSYIPQSVDGLRGETSEITAVFECIPVLVCFVFSFAFGIISDQLVNRRKIRKMSMRIIFATIGTVFPCICICILSFVKDIKYAPFAFVTLAMCMKSAFYSSVKVTVLEMTRNHAGFFAALLNAIGEITEFLATYIVDRKSFLTWDVTYLVLASSIITLIPYIMFCKTTRCEWDYYPGETKPEFPKGLKNKLICTNPNQ